MKKQTLPTLYSFNRSVYWKFIEAVTESNITSFRTQNVLAAFMENLKWPGVKNDGTKPSYAYDKNYAPIVDHLMADGILRRSADRYRIVYFVNLEAAQQKLNS